MANILNNFEGCGPTEVACKRKKRSVSWRSNFTVEELKMNWINGVTKIDLDMVEIHNLTSVKLITKNNFSLIILQIQYIFPE